MGCDAGRTERGGGLNLVIPKRRSKGQAMQDGTPNEYSRPRQPRAGKSQSLVEFAIVVPLFFLLLFALLDFGRLFYVQLSLQNAIRQGGRFGVTGRHLTDAQGNALSRTASIMQVIQRSAAGLALNPSDIQISSQQGGADSAGGPGDTMTIALTYRLQLLTPIIGQFFNHGGYQFTVATTFRNEPFPSEQPG